MTAQTLTVVSGVLTVLLGGGVIKAVLDYLAHRRTANTEVIAMTFTTLKEMNLLLEAKVMALQKELDDERARRYVLEDRVASLERDRAPHQRPEGG